VVSSHNLKNKFSNQDMKKEFSTIKVIIIGSFSLMLLSACQSNLPPERPANTGDRTRVTPVINNDDALPTLTFNQSDTKSPDILIQKKLSWKLPFPIFPASSVLLKVSSKLVNRS
jgi:hypothetical protein